MARHKPSPEIVEDGLFFEKQTCLACGAARFKRKKACHWTSWYREGIGNVTGRCPGPPKVIEAIIVSERQRPGLIIEEGGRP
mgnify:CR=1 FL=1